MKSAVDFREIARYVDELHRDVGRLVKFVEHLMHEQGYVSLPSIGNRVSFYVSPQIQWPTRWRIPQLVRFFIPAGAQVTDHSRLYLISLEHQSAFPFPTMLCAHAYHEECSEHTVGYKVWQTTLLASLMHPRPQWEVSGEELGWTVARPRDRKKLIQRLQGYIINLFDLDSRQRVVDNVIQPLLDHELDLNKVLTVTKYAVPRPDRSGQT